MELAELGIKDSSITKSGKEINGLLSPYIEGGFSDDDIAIEKVEFDKREIRIKYKVKSFFMPSDGQFHLSSLVAEMCALRAGLIYGHLDNGLSKKENEVYLLSYSIRCSKPIREMEFGFKMSIVKKIKRNSGSIYKVRFSIGNDNFVGSGSFFMPI
ncbi:hypothetical protein L4C34_12425 [Vibrio profundum]|uniref:hypothetical protein n=1 Tax=Vibrio profundum TaxID=2910247 RepID=UPI003D13DFD1